jgi:6-phospho-beta-glucosidase
VSAVKLAIIGGAGVRAPLLATSAVRRAERLDLREIWLVDVDERRLKVFGGLAEHIAARSKSPVSLRLTHDADRALDGADYVITTVRVGGDHSRVLDERIALRHGVLGQETTGAGGFAMAMRTMPAVLSYARRLQELSPEAWLLNFTNPAGLVAQGLTYAGIPRVIGICDSANLAQHAVAEQLEIEPNALRPEVFGLNHLSWTRRVLSVDGEDLLAPLLRDDEFVAATMQRFFERELRERVGMWLNEYLYYWYYAERALAAIQRDGSTRGEEVEALNAELLSELESLVDADTALEHYMRYHDRRHAHYMHYADPGGNGRNLGDNGEGYAGVALDVIEALETGSPVYTGLNVANRSAIDGFLDDDVVEMSCVIGADGVRPRPIGSIPAAQAALMHSVKAYERAAARAILGHCRASAIDALMLLPLVVSYSRARALVDDYLVAHAAWLPGWS